MPRMPAATARGARDHRRAVESALAPFIGPARLRRAPPPDGRLGSDDYPIRQLAGALSGLGPVFSSFARYLSSRLDLLPRRDCDELGRIRDAGSPAPPGAVDGLIRRQLGAPGAARFFEFDRAAYVVTLWTERHHAWIAPGVPVTVTIVRPDAGEQLERDLALLPLLQPCLSVPADAFAAAVDDFSRTLVTRLDQLAQAAALASLAADAVSTDAFHAPTCYRDYCAAGILTCARVGGPTLDEVLAGVGGAGPEPAEVAPRLAAAWLRQALGGHVVPFEIDPRDIIIDGERLVLTSATCEPHTTAERARFSRYMDAVAADDPDGAVAWIADPGTGVASTPAQEEGLRRLLRQAVPFREGEWSGEDRLAEGLLVQWRVARESRCTLSPHHLHLYRGIHALSVLLTRLAPDQDALLAAVQHERLRTGLSEATGLVDPRQLAARIDRALQDLVSLPQKLDDFLTLASEGRLRVRLRVPESDGSRRVRRQTILLVAGLAALVALASLVRQVAPASGPAVERAGVVALLVLGGWMLVAAARV
jgi:predicted unusual protein kinase regulating ubiquinone biosynthesis (AarF/ABC1/UbiB family)